MKDELAISQKPSKSPQTIMKELLSSLLESKGMPPSVFGAASKWDTLGDIELPKTCFKNPLWESVSEELWPLVAKYWMDSLLVKLEHLFGLLLLLKSITLVKSCQMVQEIVPSSECLGLLPSSECSRVTENSDREACSCWNQEEQRLNFGRYDVKRVVRSIYVLFSRSEIPIAKEDIADLLTPLPEWFTEDDLAVYASLYEKSGFRYPMEMPYRSLHKRKPIEDPKFQVPVFVVMGERPKRKPIEDPKSGCGGPTSF